VDAIKEIVVGPTLCKTRSLSGIHAARIGKGVPRREWQWPTRLQHQTRTLIIPERLGKGLKSGFKDQMPHETSTFYKGRQRKGGEYHHLCGQLLEAST
jgi:hypothetical protein